MIQKDKYLIGVSQEKTKNFHNLDCILCLFYMAASLINGIMGISGMKIFTDSGHTAGSPGTDEISTILLLAISFLLLFRMNIGLVILKRKRTEAAEEALKECASLVKINIKAVDQRMQILEFAYVAEAAIFIMNLVYKTKIETSLSALVFIPVILTTYNDLIEIWKSKYSAEERITYEYEEVQ